MAFGLKRWQLLKQHLSKGCLFFVKCIIINLIILLTKIKRN